MISAIAGLSDLGYSLMVAKAGPLRASGTETCPECGGVHPTGTAHVGSVKPATRVGADEAGETTADAAVGSQVVEDIVEISPQGRAAATRAAGQKDGDAESGGQSGSGAHLDEAEQKQVEDLKKRDTEVRTHEAAHKAAAGQYAGSVSYTYQTGPDGAKYAVGGEVPIDTSAVEGDPQATIRKMQQVRAAALAPAEPSSADQQVAARAAQALLKAQTELASKAQGGGETESDAEGSEGAEAGSPSAAMGQKLLSYRPIDVYA
jgi:hypothetical protein